MLTMLTSWGNTRPTPSSAKEPKKPPNMSMKMTMGRNMVEMAKAPTDAATASDMVSIATAATMGPSVHEQS